MSTGQTLLTAEELLYLSTIGHRYELVKGELVEKPLAGARRGAVAQEIGRLL